MRTPDGKNTVHEPSDEWLKEHFIKTYGSSPEEQKIKNWLDKNFDTDATKDVVKASQTATTGGRKFDGGKLQYGLVPPNALKATVEILTFGAEKYEPDNWKWVPDSKRRYFDAAQRHLWAWKSGEQNDQESGKNHLAHALCCLMFLYEHDTINFLDNGEVNETVK